MANSENTITSAFVNVLRHMRDAWNINEQITRPFLNATQKPDVIVTDYWNKFVTQRFAKKAGLGLCLDALG